ncbi:MAG: hypothetical protein KC646_07385 [Candidatus Cloacimonetes bacterium]|nr:hypothetical protein [Candidatus Cloacimonadota bacterium]
MGKLREQLHEETVKLDMANWIKERNIKSTILKNEHEGTKEEAKAEISPF